ncbi:TPA: 50S ribosomal protein L44e [Candidatus Micrarchaeota archaeon]|nr:50S ribosomal protein L44e [Candidatus Micrarchaeota archaeon]
MIVPKELNAYCPSCKKHSKHKVKVSTSKAKKGRTLAWGNLRQERKLKGYHGKVAGKKKVKKQGVRNKIMLECLVCHKKYERTISGRMKKKAETAK